MNIITIKGLECFGKHGVLKEENVLGQKFVVSARLHVEKSKNDDLNTTVNYAEISKFIYEYVKKNVFKLIETLADNIAAEILKRFKCNEIDIKIEKPFAPIGLPLDTVSVEVSKKWSRAYLGIGSNMGDKRKYIDDAINLLKNDDNVRLVKVSDLIVTKAYGYTEQDDFLNGAIAIDTLYDPYELLDFISSIEQNANRKREIHWGPRTLDLDILLYENFVSDDPKLTVPHIDMQNREFVLKPLSQIAPYAFHSVLNKSVIQLYSELKSNQNVIFD